MKTKIGILIFCVLMNACGKDDEMTTSVNKNELFAISGSLSILTGYSDATSLKILSGQKVYIRVDTGTNKSLSNYFYSVLSSGNGSFKFFVSDTLLPYAVFSSLPYESSPTYSLLYYGSESTKTPFSKPLQLIVKPDSIRQNGINVTTVDENGSRASRANLVLYTSQAIALSDADTLSGSGSVIKAQTDSMGRVFIKNLPQDILYINTQIISGTDTFSSIASPVQILNQKIIEKTLVLKKQ